VTKKYWPRTIEELAEDPIPVSFINQPLLPESAAAARQCSHAGAEATALVTCHGGAGLGGCGGFGARTVCWLSAAAQMLSAVLRLELE
jgi:hypothetical protein